MQANQTGKLRTTRKTPAVTTTARSTGAAAPAHADKVPKLRKKSSPAIAESAWREMVATAACYRAQSRGFQPGSDQQDWLAAEAELKKQLRKA